MNLQRLRGSWKKALQGNGVAHPPIFHFSESFRQEWRGGRQAEKADGALSNTADPHGHPWIARAASSQPPCRHQAVFGSTVYWKLIWVFKKKLHKNIEATNQPLISSPQTTKAWGFSTRCITVSNSLCFSFFLTQFFSSPTLLAWPEQFSLTSISYEVKLFNL